MSGSGSSSAHNEIQVPLTMRAIESFFIPLFLLPKLDSVSWFDFSFHNCKIWLSAMALALVISYFLSGSMDGSRGQCRQSHAREYMVFLRLFYCAVENDGYVHLKLKK